MAGIYGISAYKQDMNVSLYSQTSYMSGMTRSVSSRYSEEINQQRKDKDQQMRELIRNLDQMRDQDKNPFAATSRDKADGFLDLSESKDDDSEKTEKPVNYNYKEVASKIQRAKTSASAGQALLSAKRKVMEVKRKISSGNGDPDELQLALTHARRMEMAARKKKHHLELEEMVVNTQRRDENADDAKKAASDVKNAVVAAQEEKIAAYEDEVFDKREKRLSELKQQLEENSDSVTEEMITGLNEMIAEYGENELKEFEEAMESLENMEIIDPHMSREELEELKRKHRASENKAIAKADMDYLKGFIDLKMEPSVPNGVSIDVKI